MLKPKTLLFSGVSKFLRILLVNPIINVVVERSYPTFRRSKIILQTTISQEQLNNFML